MPKALNLTLPPRRQPTTGRWPILGQHLAYLINQLGDDTDCKRPAERTIPPLTAWADAHYLYLEIDLPRGTFLESDISISHGKAFIRLEK